MRQRRRSEENGFVEDEQRPERSRGHFVSTINDVGRSLASSAQLKCVETGGSEEFWVNMSGFSNFWSFLIKLGDVGRVLKAVTIWIGSGDPGGDCDLRLTPNCSLFWCSSLVTAGGCDELATVEIDGGHKTMSLGSGRLVWTRATSFVCSEMLGERIWGGVFEKMDGILTFSSFGVKLTNFLRVL